MWFLFSPSLTAEKPNILFIFADDLSYEAVGFSGNETVMTPHLDALAASGVSYHNAYNMGSWTGAVCIASRTMFNTGHSLWRAHTASKNLTQQAADRLLWPQRLSDVGYHTYMTGKWHVSISPEAVFDTVRNERPGMPLDYHPLDRPEAYHRPPIGKQDQWSPSDTEQGGFWAGGTHWSEVVADDALSFLEDASNRNEPFFIYVAFNASHDPRQSPQRFLDLYPPDKIPVPQNFVGENPLGEAMGCGRDLRDEMLAPFPRTTHAVQVHRSEYYAIISHMDEQIGRILHALQASGQADNTYIFFTADHGLAVGHHGLLGKQNMYEHSLKSPLLIAGPKIPKGEVRTVPVYIQDISATTLELAQADASMQNEFHSLLPTSTSPGTRSPYHAIYAAYKDRQRMIIQDDFKLILIPSIDRLQLFNLKADPFEMEDLSNRPAYQTLKNKLLHALIAEQNRLGDPLDLSRFLPKHEPLSPPK